MITKMRLAYFGFAFLILLAMASFAKGVEITEVRFYVNYDDAYVYRLENKDRTSWVFGLSNNSRINADVLPGSNVTFTLRLANTLTGGHENEIRGVFSRVRIEEIDDGSDLEETSLDVDLDAGSDALVDVNFGIPVDVNAGTYNVIIEAEGDSRNRTLYQTEINLKLSVKKESHDIRITRYQAVPSIFDCSRKTKIIADIMNAGSSSEDQVALEFKSDQMGISSITRDIALESSNDASADEKIYTKTLNAEIPAYFNTGVYPILVNLYWKNTILFDQKILYLTVRDCGGKTTTEQTQNSISSGNASANQQPQASSQTSEPDQSGYGVSSQTGKFSPSPALVFILLGGFLIFVIAIVLVFAFSKKK